MCRAGVPWNGPLGNKAAEVASGQAAEIASCSVASTY